MAVEGFPIEAGQIMLFARAIGDPNPIYSDAKYAAATELGGIIAPPTFVQASAQYDPDYPLRPKIGEPWFGSGREPTGAQRDAGAGTGGSGGGGGGGGGTGLHAEQHFEYHRPIRPGEVLSVTTRRGESWEKQGRRAGLLKFSELIQEFRDESGEPVVTARIVSVRTERVVEREES
jgi:N-terminal half of MaoC dehydratase